MAKVQYSAFRRTLGGSLGGMVRMGTKVFREGEQDLTRKVKLRRILHRVFLTFESVVHVVDFELSSVRHFN